MTFISTKLIRMTVSRKILHRLTLSRMTLSRMTLIRIPFVRMTFIRMTLIKMKLMNSTLTTMTSNRTALGIMSCRSILNGMTFARLTPSRTAIKVGDHLAEKHSAYLRLMVSNRAPRHHYDTQYNGSVVMLNVN